MYYQDDREQLNIEEFFQPFGGRLRKDNRWVRLAVMMPWEYIEKGRLKGSDVRAVDAEQPMTEYEIYSYEAFRRKYQDDIRPVEQSGWNILDKDSLEQYLGKLKTGRPNLSQQKAEEICELVGLTRDGIPTLAAVYCSAFFPRDVSPSCALRRFLSREVGPEGGALSGQPAH